MEEEKKEEDADVVAFIKHPLNLREITPESLEDENIQALQSLIFEGEPNKVALNFLRHGKEYLERAETRYQVTGKAEREERIEKQLSIAIDSFTQGIDAKSSDSEIIYALYQHRAKSSYILKNYRNALNDIVQCQSISSLNLHLFDMKIRILDILRKYEEGIQVSLEAIKAYPDETQLKILFKSILDSQKKEIEYVKKAEAIKNLDLAEQIKIFNALRLHGVTLGEKIHSLPESIDAKIVLDKNNSLHFPVLLVYEEHMIIDVIKDFRENSTLYDELKEIFKERAPWDKDNSYYLDKLEAYYEINCTTPVDQEFLIEKSNFKYKKCEMKVSLITILKEKQFILPQFPAFTILAKGTEFYDHFIQNNKV